MFSCIQAVLGEFKLFVFGFCVMVCGGAGNCLLWLLITGIGVSESIFLTFCGFCVSPLRFTLSFGCGSLCLVFHLLDAAMVWYIRSTSYIFYRFIKHGKTKGTETPSYHTNNFFICCFA